MKCPTCNQDPCIGIGFCSPGWKAAAREYGQERPPLQPYWEPLYPEGPPPVGPNGHGGGRLSLTAAEFVAGFVSPDYLIDGVLQRGYIYSLTARTNHGKTALSLLLLHHVATSKPLHGREVAGGAVLYLAGENPDNIRARLLVQCEYYQADAATMPVYFVDGIIDLSAKLQTLRDEFAAIKLALVVVDTAAAYFVGDDPNNNAQQGAYARLLRELTSLPGKPAVVVNGHPVKNASRDNLLPIGGGAYLNEIDGNLTAWANDERQVTLHWQGKFRGPEFEPLSFELVMVESPKVVDAKGRLMPSVVAIPISEAAVASGEQRLEYDENRILRALAECPRATHTFLATKCGFIINGRPQTSRVGRLLQQMKKHRLVDQPRGTKYVITAKGKKEIGLDDEDDD
jgi:AAA domain